MLYFLLCNILCISSFSSSDGFSSMPARVGTVGQAAGNSRQESGHPAFDQEPGHSRVGLMRGREEGEGEAAREDEEEQGG